MTCPPQLLHHLRKLVGGLLYVPTLSAPLVIWTDARSHRVNALTGPADQLRQEVQWQNPIAAGWPVTVSSTAPQKQFPLYVFSLLIWFSSWTLTVDAKLRPSTGRINAG